MTYCLTMLRQTKFFYYAKYWIKVKLKKKFSRKRNSIWKVKGYRKKRCHTVTPKPDESNIPSADSHHRHRRCCRRPAAVVSYKQSVEKGCLAALETDDPANVGDSWRIQAAKLVQLQLTFSLFIMLMATASQIN